MQDYLVDLGGRESLSPDPITLEALTRALDAKLEVLEQVWQAWEVQLARARWSEAHWDEAQYWLDAVVIGGPIFPELHGLQTSIMRTTSMTPPLHLFP